MDNLVKNTGFWIQNLLLLLYISMASGTKRNGVKLTNESGVITTPGYPNGYPNSIAFIWLINTTLNKYIELTFLDFDVEPYSNCNADYVKIRNKKASRANFRDVPQIDLTTKEPAVAVLSKGPYCNSNRPPKIVTSSSNLMAIVFLADSSESYRGFKASYRSLERKPCSFVKTENHGTISTPGFPLRYPSEGACVWKITVPRGKFIRLEFLEFDLEFNTQLCMDQIYIYDGESESATTLARGCRSSPRVIYSSTNHLRIKFTSQGYHRNKGFKAMYTTSSSKGCGGDFNLRKGTFTSPSFNLLASYTYPAYSNCSWSIRAPTGHVISLKFKSFDVSTGSSGHCDEDYLDVYGASEKAGNLIGRYCNANKPSVVTSRGNSLNLRFVSNQKSHGNGFQIEYRRHSTACDQPLGMEDGRILDHSIAASSYLRQNSKYKQSNARLNSRNAWCSQIQINNRGDEYLQIDFRDLTKITGFSTQGYSLDGQNYYVTKYKILYSNDGGRFFTSYISSGTESSKSEYEIFKANKDSTGIQRNNFLQPIVAKIFRVYPLGYAHGKKRVICTRAEIYGCKFKLGDGSLLRNPDDNILYTATRATTHSSQWVISPSNIYRNAAFYVMPLFFNIDCQKAVVKIYDGLKHKSYCGANQPPWLQVFSARKQLLVKFEKKGDGDIRHQGFGLQYFTENLGSGRILRSRRGIVRSARHVQERVSNTTASTWIIIQPNKKRIVARFTALRLGKRRDGTCDEYVEIKDGLLDSSPSYGNFCIGMPLKTLVSSGNYLKVVLHSQNNALRFKRDMGKSRIAFEIAYTTLSNTYQPTERHLTKKADEPSLTILSTPNRGYCGGSKLNTYLALLVLLMTLQSIFFPR